MVENEFLHFNLADIATLAGLLVLFLRVHAAIVEMKFKVETLWNRYLKESNATGNGKE